jgi:hypothetical protein
MQLRFWICDWRLEWKVDRVCVQERRFYWMELIVDGGLVPKEGVESLHQEAGELTAMMAASRITAASGAIANRNSQI